MLGFLSLELGQPGKPACPDEYSEASTLRCGGAVKARIQISLAAVYVSFGQGEAGLEWAPDEPLLPIIVTIPRRFDAVRVKNFTKGEPAQVLITAYPAGA